MSASTDELSRTALLLRNAAPETYDHLLQTMQVLVDEITVAVTEASPNDILVLQGRAQQARAWFRTFKECDQVKRKPPTP
jgi:hypothetical protein